MRIPSLVVALALLLGPLSTGGEPGPEDPQRILETAFDRMFNYPSVRTILLRIHRRGRSVTRREFDVAYKKIEDRGHTLLRFTEPEYLRDNALLMVERSDGSSDTWLYQDSERRTRRVGTSQKADAFYGSDLTFEDLEHHDWDRFDVSQKPDAKEQDRPCYVVEARPRGDSQYSKIVVRVEKARHAILRIDFYRGRAERPLKSLLVDPDEIVEQEGLLKPKRFWIRQHGREAGTLVEFLRIEADPNITSTVFTSMRLEQSGLNLYHLVQRLRREGQP